jgi:hypothetical protein
MAEGQNDWEWQVGLATHEWKAAEIQYSLALEPVDQGETPVSFCDWGVAAIFGRPLTRPRLILCYGPL